MTRNEQQSVGFLLTAPRTYSLQKRVFLLGRSTGQNAGLVAASGASTGDKVLDIGSGPGDLARAIAARVGPSGTVVGVDAARQMVEYATKQSHGQSNCRFEVGAAQSLDQPDGAFDVVTSTFVMHHVPEAERGTALAQMFRVLRPGGRLLLADTHPAGPVSAMLIRGMARIAARHGDGPGDGHDHGDGHSHSPGAEGDPLAAIDIRRYRDTVLAAGFSDVEFTVVKPLAGVLTAVKPG